MEVGKNNKTINFLDLKIDITTGTHVFEIYRKETFSDNIIPANSRHPNSHKLSCFHSMIHRLLNIPLQEDAFRKEVQIIKKIASNNGYDQTMVENMLRRKEKQMVQHLIYPTRLENETLTTKWRRIPYMGNISTKIANKLSKRNIRPAFYTQNNLGKLLKEQPKMDRENRNGIYKWDCDTCSAVYVGQTGRAFGVRLKEHEKRENSTVFQHLKNENHVHSKDNWKALHYVEKGKKMDSLEKLEINRCLKDYNVNLLNEVLTGTSPLLHPVKLNALTSTSTQ